MKDNPLVRIPHDQFFDKNDADSLPILMKKNAAIIFIYHPMKYGLIEDTTKLNIQLLHQEREFDLYGQRAWSEYLLNTKEILLVLVGKTQGIDSLQFENEISFLGESIQGIFKVWKGLAEMEKADATTPPQIEMRFVYLNKRKLIVPGKLSFAVPYDKNEKTEFQKISFKIHERNRLAFSLGVPVSKLDKKQFSLNNDTLNVELDSAQKEEWKSNLTVGLEFYPFGRDIDRFTPIWKKPFYRPWERVGIYAGVKFSSKPFDAVYGGITISLSKQVSFIAGMTWVKTTDVQKMEASEGADLDDAMDDAKKSIEESFYLGISLSPSLMLKSIK